MEKKKQKLMISGATGLLGSYVLRHLLNDNNYEIVALRRSSSDTFFVRDIYNEITWHIGDILDITFLDEICIGIDYFIHVAGLISFHKSDISIMNEINITGTANVVNSCLKNRVNKLIHISSVAALGRPEHTSNISETTLWETSKNNTAYAKSKHEADMEVQRGAAEGLNTCIIYPSTILGTGDWTKGSTALFRRVYDGLKYYTKGINGFVDARDVARVSVKAIEADISIEGVIVSAENLSYQYVFNEMAKRLKVKKPTRLLTQNKAKMALLWDGLISLITKGKSKISEDALKVAFSEYLYNNEKSKKWFGIEYIPIEQSIEEICKILDIDQ